MNPDDLARLIDTHAAPLELFARQWCDDPADVVQAAFMRLIEQAEPPVRPAAWLYSVVRNVARMRRRAERRRRTHEDQALRANVCWFEPTLDEGLDAETATEALAEIAEEVREVLIARIWGSLTFDDIGELTETSSSTAHRRYLEGIELLRKKLGVSCPNE